ncbi:hypothetical protein [Gottfriedia acidiceleris]|uniref:hypothetical protein n=1 Tax=Gottfriedia acidiceleris TaxID=371036 RepID=UPI003D2398B4
MLTIQKAAAELLKEANKPLNAKVIAKLALEREMIKKSSAVDPIQSLSQTLERNVRNNTGNHPRLEFISTEDGRCLALPEWGSSEDALEGQNEEYKDDLQEIRIKIHNSILNKVKIHQLSNDYKNIDEALLDLIKKGLWASSDELIKKLKSDLDDLCN